jgi:hypothetical protein
MSSINVLDAAGAVVAVNTPNTDGQATMANSRPVVIASDQSTVPVNQSEVSTTGTVTALNANLTSGVATANSAVQLDLNGASGFAADIRGTWTGTIQFQGTINGTNWFTLATIPAGSAANIASVTSTTANGQWIGNAAGLLAVRATVSAAPTGTATIVLRAKHATGLTFNLPSGQTTQAVSGTVAVSGVSGNVATIGAATEDAATATAPVITGGVVRDTNAPTTLVAGDAARATMSRGAALVTKPYAVAETGWIASLALTTTTAAALQSAAAAGLKRHITALQAINTGAAVVDLIILDGATERWRLPLPVNVPVLIQFPTELVTTAATALNANLSAAGSVRVNAQGYTSA